jgi:isopentenyl diphosphate isomerase/L-lactate dehydrogenase-like FMN-dependent dehydrogenase
LSKVDLERILNLSEFEGPARENMAPYAFAYFAGGASDEVTLRGNIEAFGRFALRPRVFVDVSSIDPATTMLGVRVSIPVAFAPTALHKLAHPDGEIASALACNGAGALMCLSTLSSVSIEDVAQVSTGPRWFQLYVHKERSVAIDLVQRAVASGYSAIVVTADLPVPGYREREYRHDLTIPDDARPVNFGNTATEEEFNHYLVGLHDQSLTWDDLGWMREAAGDVPLVLKGILTAEDAILAVEHGVAGIIVSNHGGRQLDRSPAAIDVLEEIVQAVGDRAEVYLDGGVRRGADVLIALGLGARAVFLGRPLLYALATAGEAGVGRAFELIRAEIENSMALLGTATLGDIHRSHVS